MYLDPGSTADDIDPSCKCNIKGQTWEESWLCECEEGYEINEDWDECVESPEEIDEMPEDVFAGCAREDNYNDDQQDYCETT